MLLKLGLGSFRGNTGLEGVDKVEAWLLVTIIVLDALVAEDPDWFALAAGAGAASFLRGSSVSSWLWLVLHYARFDKIKK